ncbi:MAG: TolC family protein [Verrucomicrobiales bacterium]
MNVSTLQDLAIAALVFYCPCVQGLEITLMDVPARVAHANPELAAARLMIEEARGRQVGAGRLMNPELQLTARRMTEGEEGGWTAGLMQKFPITRRLRLEKAVTAVQLSAAEAEVADRRRMLTAEAEIMAVKILGMRAEIRIAGNQAALADKMAELAAARAAANESALEAGQMKLDARQSRNLVRRMQAEIAAMSESLKPMLGMAASESLTVAGSLPAAQLPAAAQPDDSRPDIQAAVRRAEAAGQSVNLARAKKWDDWSGGLMVDRNRTMDMPQGLMDETMVGLQLSIPLPFWNKNQGEIVEAEAMRARSLAEVEALRLKAGGEAASARREMQELRPVLEEYSGQLLPLAKQQIELVRDSYVNNRATLQDVLRARDRLLMIEMNTTAALRDFHLAHVRWKAAVSGGSAAK